MAGIITPAVTACSFIPDFTIIGLAYVRFMVLFPFKVRLYFGTEMELSAVTACSFTTDFIINGLA